MRTSKRPLKVKPQLESMEARDVPSAFSLRLWALAHAQHASQLRLPNQVRHANQVQHARQVAAQTAAARWMAARPMSVFRTVAPSLHTTSPLATSHLPTVSSMVSRPSHPAASVATPVARPSNPVVITHVSSNNSNHASTSAAASTSAQTQATTTTDIGDVKNGPLAKAGQDLIKLYQNFKSSGHASGTGLLQVVGDQVRVDVRGSVDANTLAGALSSLGMQVQNTDANTHTVEGLLPIAQLPNVAQMSQVTSISPVYRMQVR